MEAGRDSPHRPAVAPESLGALGPIRTPRCGNRSDALGVMTTQSFCCGNDVFRRHVWLTNIERIEKTIELKICLRRAVNHVFVIHTHRDISQIKRLVATLKSQLPNSIVLVSHDIHGEPIEADDISACGAILLRGRGGRGDFSILDGYMDAIRWLKASRIQYDWISTLSGQDFPTRPLVELDTLLRESSLHGFLQYFDALKPASLQGRSMSWSPETGDERYYFQYKNLKSRLSFAERVPLRYIRKAAASWSKSIRINPSYGLMLGKRSDHTPFKGDFRCYAGGYWATIRRECAEYLVYFSDNNKNIVDYYRKVLVPDESFIQTVLVNNRSFRFESNNFRYVDFTGSRHGRPKTLVSADLKSIRGSDAYFCRKLESGASDSLYVMLDYQINHT